MKKRILVLAPAVAVLGGAILISAIGSAHRSPSHWRTLSTASVL